MRALRVRPFVSSSCLAAVAALISSTGCVAAPDAGQLEVALTGQSASGSTYRLRDARIDLSGAGVTRTFLTEDDPSRTALTARVDAGAYSLDLADGWRLERIPAGGGAAQPVTAVLTSPDPQALQVAGGVATRAVLRFRVSGEDVSLGQGDVVVTIDVDDVDAGVPASDAPVGPVIDAMLAPPTVSFISGPAPVSNATSATFTFSVTGGDTGCQLDEAPPLPCTSPWTAADLTEGSHVVTVFAAGPGGTATAARAFTIDRTPPTVTFVSEPPPSSTSTLATVAFVAGGDAVATECAVDAGAYVICSSPFTTPPLGAGAHTIRVRATDAAANAASATTSFVVE